MSKLISTAAVIVALGLAGAARAADVYEGGGMKDAPVYEAPASWAGFYFGGNVGGVFNDDSDLKNECEKYDLKEKDNDGNDMSATIAVANRADGPSRRECRKFYKEYGYDVFDGFGGDDDGELIGGVHVGYNWQWAQKVFGIEADVGFADGIDYLASIRGRLGFAITDDLLIYGTGGVAFLGLENDYDLPGYDGDDDTLTGYVVGGGIEKKVANNISIGVEGLYYNFEEDEFEHDDGFYSVSDEQDFFVVRGRLTFHMGGEVVEPLK